MAETSTAEIVRDRPETPRPEPAEGPVASPPPVQPVVDFKSIAENILKSAPVAPPKEELDAARMKATDAREAASKRASDFAAAQAPEIEATKKAGEAFAADAIKARPQAPQLPPPPSKGLHGFLQPTKDEQPETSIAKLLQGVGLLATMIGGGRNGARASLSAFTGALEGWKVGDRERADRAFADWKAQTDRMLEQWQVELGGYELWFRSAGVPLEQKMLGLKLDAMARGNQKFADEIDVGNADSVVKGLEARQAQALDVQKEAAKLYAMHEEANKRHEERQQWQDQQFWHWQDLLKEKRDARDAAASQLKEQVSSYSKESLRALGQQWALDQNGKMPIGAPRGKVGEMIRPQIVAEGIAWAKEQGIDPMTLPSVRAEIGAAKSALTKLTGVNAIQIAAIRRFDGHLDALVKLSEEVPRSEMPAVNAAILRGEVNFQGSPKAAAYVAQAFEVGMELSRVVVGTAQGDASTREEARKAIGVALNHDQLKAVATQLRQNAHRNIETNKQSQAELLDVITRAGGGSGVKPEAAKTPGGTMQILRKSDGKVFEGPSGPIPAGYEAVK